MIDMKAVPSSSLNGRGDVGDDFRSGRTGSPLEDSTTDSATRGSIEGASVVE